MLVQKDYHNSAAWQINRQEKLINEIDKNPNEILLMSLEIWKIYTEYFN